MCGVFVGMEQLEMVMALLKRIKVQLRAEREVAVAGVTDMALGRELFTHLWMHSVIARGTCPTSDVLLKTSDWHLEPYVEELQINTLSLLCFKFLFHLHYPDWTLTSVVRSICSNGAQLCLDILIFHIEYCKRITVLTSVWNMAPDSTFLWFCGRLCQEWWSIEVKTCQNGGWDHSSAAQAMRRRTVWQDAKPHFSVRSHSSDALIHQLGMSVGWIRFKSGSLLLV